MGVDRLRRRADDAYSGGDDRGGQHIRPGVEDHLDDGLAAHDLFDQDRQGDSDGRDSPRDQYEVGRAMRSTFCRSLRIKTPRRAEEPATPDAIRPAALQFVRQVSCYRVPSRATATAFDGAVDEIADASRRLLDSFA